MANQASTPLWLDLKIDYIDENFNKVFHYIHKNIITSKDPFYDITIDLLEKRIESLIQEFKERRLQEDDAFAQDKERMQFTARLLGLYLLAVDNSSKNYRTAFLLFAYTLALLEPRNISMAFVSRVIKFVVSTLPSKSILEWGDIETLYPEIVAHKINEKMQEKMGYVMSDCFERMGTLQLSLSKLKLAATNRLGFNQSLASSLSVADDIIQIMTPKSDKLKQSKASEIVNIKEFTSQFIADQSKLRPTLKRYIAGEMLRVRVTGKQGGHLQVVSVNREYHPIEGEVVFDKNFLFYNEQDFLDAVKVGYELDVTYKGDEVFDLKDTFLEYTREYLYKNGEELCAKAVMISPDRIGWGTQEGFGVYTPFVEGIQEGDCAEIRMRQLIVDRTDKPTGWINGEFIQVIDEYVDYDQAKFDTISDGFAYTDSDTEQVHILSAEFVKSLYRLLILAQQHCVSNPTDRYQILSVCKMLAALLGYEQDVAYIGFLAEYLENLVCFAKSEYDQMFVPQFPEECKTEDMVRKDTIISILQAYGTPSNSALLDDIIALNEDELLVKIATLVQSCNRLENVINPSMQNVIKREIIANLSVETEGETNLEEDNGIYLGIENGRQEFKTSFFHAPQSAKEQRQKMTIFKGVCAFLNTTDGGTLYLGVNDLGYVQGVDDDIKYLQTITYGNYKGVDGYMRYITDQAKEYFDIDVVANIKMHPMYENKVIALEIAPYEFGIVKLEDVAYLRVNSESLPVNESTSQRISARKNLSGTKKNSTVEELSKAIRSKQCVVLRNYQSSNSNNVRDRRVEVFDFTENGGSVWCYDLDNDDIRLFNIARIGYVEVTKQAWTHQNKHKPGPIDIFNMTGSTPISICLRLNLRAKNLLVEEYPRSKEFITKERDNSWLLTTTVYNVAGVARFYMGLANSIQIVSAPELKTYVAEYCKQYLS